MYAEGTLQFLPHGKYNLVLKYEPIAWLDHTHHLCRG